MQLKTRPHFLLTKGGKKTANQNKKKKFQHIIKICETVTFLDCTLQVGSVR